MMMVIGIRQDDVDDHDGDGDHDDDGDRRPAHGATRPDPTVVAARPDAALGVNPQSEIFIIMMVPVMMRMTMMMKISICTNLQMNRTKIMRMLNFTCR